MKKLFASLALASVAACAAQPGEFRVYRMLSDGQDVTDGGVFADFEHIPGDTECPQLATTLTVIASDDADLTQSILLSVDDGNGIDVLDFDDGVGVATGDLEIVDLLPGESVDVDLLFNCANDQDFDVDLIVSSDHPDAVDTVGTVSGTFN
jgi:hypothetical protein